ncbi:MAG: acyl-[acyl-carrier-protein]-phospholipid O-acyltransferase, partial [Planctomycetota bacterium]
MFHLLRNRSFAALTVTQFLGAFNDNAFKQLVLLLSLSTALPWIAESGWVHEWGQSLGLALFSLPFVLFGVLTGSLSDRVSKRTVMVRANAAEVVVMVLGGLAVYLQRYELLLGALFLMGLQSAFFGPGKYGSIAEMTETRDLSRANGWIQLTTTIAIVIGTALGGLLFERFEGGLLFAMGTFVGISVLGFLSSLALSPSPAMAPDRPIAWNPVREVRRQWALVGRDRPLVLSLLASAFFWLIGAVLMLVINEYGNWLQLPASKIALLLTILSLGIGLGSFLAARLSGDRIESGLIPAGLLGMALCTAGVGLAADSANWLRVCLLGTGISAGLFTIPIRALIQHLPPPDNRGAILGLSEMLDFIGIFLASGLFALFNIGLDLDPPLMMTGVGAITLLFAVGSVFYTAEFALRFWLALLFRTIYRVRTEGIENIPRRGGALLVCNHLSYVDAFLVSAAIGRPVRFMMYSAFFDLPVIGHFARVIGAIPVSAEDTRDAKRASIDRAAKLLREGELVCIFAEGGISRNGSLLGFRKGLERIARAAGTPIVPVALDGVWGSIFSFEGGRFFWKLPKHLNNPVDAWIGKELPSDTPAWKVRSAVQYLLTRSRSQLAGRQDTLSNRFLRSARKHAKKLAVVDSGGTRLTYRKLLQSSLAMRSLFARRFAGEQNVGIFLPPGAGAVIANLAISLSGRSPINLNYSLGHAELQEPMRRAGVKHV